MSTSLDPGRKVKVGIIGSGGIARLHARYYKPLPFVEITAVADIVPGRARAFVEREGLEGAVAYEATRRSSRRPTSRPSRSAPTTWRTASRLSTRSRLASTSASRSRWRRRSPTRRRSCAPGRRPGTAS